MVHEESASGALLSPSTPDSSESLMWDRDLLAEMGRRPCSSTLSKVASWSRSPPLKMEMLRRACSSESSKLDIGQELEVDCQAIDVLLGIPAEDNPFCYSVPLNRYKYITGGYRPVPSSLRECVASIFQLHNETVNIWTHVVGTMIFVVLLWHLLATGEILGGQFLSGSRGKKIKDRTLMPGSDVPVLAMYLLSGIICFLLSAVYHTVTSASDAIVRLAERADQLGILCLMLGSNFPMIYFGFFNHPGIILLYTAVSLAGVAGVVGALQFSVVQRRKLFVFLALAALGWCQLAHDLYLRGALGSPESNAAILVWVRSFGCYAVGVVFYASKAPERILPGFFDFLFSSHQFWHVAVVAGALVHLFGCLEYARLARVPGAG
jgi:adiponectin receptor